MTNQDPPIFLTVGNRKGGVGKTTSVVNLATYLAIVGYKILVVDTDPQANCSSILLKNFNERDKPSLIDALEAPPGKGLISEIADDTFHPRMKIVSNTTRSVLWERKIAQDSDAVLGIKRLIRQDPALNDYDFVFFDTPPNLGVMMNNALMASDYVIIPIPPSDQFSLDGLAAYLDLIQSIRQYNNRLKLLGVLITKYDPSWGNSSQNLTQIRIYFAEKGINIFQTHIHTCPEIDIANAERKTIFELNLESSGSTEYSALGKNILELCNVLHDKNFI